MKRKMFVVGMTLVCAAMFAAPIVTVAAEGSGDGEKMTQGQLAQILVKKLGLSNFLPPNPSDLECIMILSQNGIFPSPTLSPTEQNPAPGWNLNSDADVTLADLAVLLVRGLGLEGTVQGDKADSQNWLNALQAVNVPTDTVAGGVQALIPLPAAIQNLFASRLVGDPLTKIYIPESSGSGMINTITFPGIAAPVTRPAGEGRPTGMTPT